MKQMTHDQWNAHGFATPTDTDRADNKAGVDTSCVTSEGDINYLLLRAQRSVASSRALVTRSYNARTARGG